MPVHGKRTLEAQPPQPADSRPGKWVCGVVLLLAFCAGCARQVPPPTAPPGSPKPYRVGDKWYQPLPDAKGFRQRGVASWYGDDFHGKRTSSGQIYNMYAMTAAHKTLPLGTTVRVHNLENGRGVEVVINDRGPFVRGRIIDLSYTAAKKIGMVGPGTAPVVVEAVSPPPLAPPGDPNVYYTGNFTIQVAAFKSSENARKLRDELAATYRNAHVAIFEWGNTTYYRVRVGRSRSLDEALQWEDSLVRRGFSDAFVVAE